MTAGDDRLARLLELARREDEHLLAVRERLFARRYPVDAQWVASVVERPEGIDRLESFAAKFARLQDHMVDKLLPDVLRRAGEPVAAAIDNLNRAERLGFLEDVDAWLAARRLRNRLVHEYVEDSAELARALNEAFTFTDRLHATLEALRRYAADRLGVTGG